MSPAARRRKRAQGRSDAELGERRDIADQIGAIQLAAADAAQAIEQANEIVGEMAGIAASVAATFDQQNAALSPWQKACRASGEARGGGCDDECGRRKRRK